MSTRYNLFGIQGGTACQAGRLDGQIDNLLLGCDDLETSP